jgi:hypothetical protein
MGCPYYSAYTHFCNLNSLIKFYTNVIKIFLGLGGELRGVWCWELWCAITNFSEEPADSIMKKLWIWRQQNIPESRYLFIYWTSRQYNLPPQRKCTQLLLTEIPNHALQQNVGVYELEEARVCANIWWGHQKGPHIQRKVRSSHRVTQKWLH